MDERARTATEADPYKRLASSIILVAVLDYMEPSHTGRHQEAKQWLCGDFFEFLCDGIGLDPSAALTGIDERREEFYVLVEEYNRTKEGDEIREWWRSHFAHYKIPLWTGARLSG